jgi:hypothetical protein
MLWQSRAVRVVAARAVLCSAEGLCVPPCDGAASAVSNSSAILGNMMMMKQQCYMLHLGASVAFRVRHFELEAWILL